MTGRAYIVGEKLTVAPYWIDHEFSDHNAANEFVRLAKKERRNNLFILGWRHISRSGLHNWAIRA